MTPSGRISRRTFLTVAGAMPLAGAALAAFQTSKSVPIGIELYSVRSSLGPPFMNNPNALGVPATVTAVAKMGYQVVEFFAPYYTWTPAQAKEIRSLVDGLGVKCLSTHNNASNFTPENLQKTIDLNQAIGSKYMIVASAARMTTLDNWKAFGDQMTAVMEKLRPLGMAVGFHNHQTEWPLLEGKRPMDVLAASTPKDFVLQFDVGTCVEAGQDPVAWVKANPGRIKSIHLKDWGAGQGRGYSVAFGEGDVPWKPILEAAESGGGVEFYLIEQEQAGPAGDIAMAQHCMDNWKKLRNSTFELRT
jgi:sugar phosphate isomerase/epimerase